jgi:phycocyanobilin:ferredoxin oxidoreductase
VTSPFGFAALVAETEDTLVQQLGLRPVALEPALAQADGAWKGEPVSLTTRAYSGGAVRYARFARLVGPDLEIGNVLCLPDPLYPLPILGADLVALGRATGMVAADLSPTLPAGADREHQLALLASLGLTTSALPSGGALPAWCQTWFSPYALYTRVPPERAGDARRACAVFVQAFVDLIRQATPRPEQASAVRAMQAGYAAAHRSDDKGLGLLARMFGAAWAERYIGAALFPRDVRPSRASDYLVRARAADRS